MSHRSIAPRIRLLAPAALTAVTAACLTARTPHHPVAAAPDSVRVAYGTQDRRDVTGAIATIDDDVARRGTATSMADLLEGRVPGLEVTRLAGGRVSVRVRGVRSLNSSGEPLYVVDGIPMQTTAGVLPDLDPRDVKSVSVLKDAGALAAYGSRGANGVLLITTRRAR